VATADGSIVESETDICRNSQIAEVIAMPGRAAAARRPTDLPGAVGSLGLAHVNIGAIVGT
jgi:hypothetical protein